MDKKGMSRPTSEEIGESNLAAYSSCWVFSTKICFCPLTVESQATLVQEGSPMRAITRLGAAA
jgi:hypothetical protein